MCMRVEFHQRKNGLSAFFASLQVVERRLGDLLVDRLHALRVERAGQLDLLRAVRVGPGVDHPARAVLLDQSGILEVVGILGLLLGVQVVERAHELVEPVRGRQRRIGVAEVVLAELRGHVALALEQLRERHVARLQAFLGAGQSDLEVAGPEAALPRDERGAAGGTALLAVPVGEHRAFAWRCGRCSGSCSPSCRGCRRSRSSSRCRRPRGSRRSASSSRGPARSWPERPPPGPERPRSSRVSTSAS